MRGDLQAWIAAVLKPGPFAVPGVVVAINDEYTCAGVDGAGRPLKVNDIWPSACLTKLAIADATVKAMELDSPINDVVGAGGVAITPRQLLTHTSGLPLDLPIELYGELTNELDVFARIVSMKPTFAPGAAMSYSNVGYGWLVLALCRIAKCTPTALFHSYGLIWGDEVPEDPVTIADIRSPFSGTEREPVNSAYWRSLHLPWCGTFASLFTIQRLFHSLDPRVLEPAPTVSGGFPPGAFFGFSDNSGCQWESAAWAHGVELRGSKNPHWISPNAPSTSYGHVGSSGILVWRSDTTTLIIAGARTTDGGWMMRHGPAVSKLAFSESMDRSSNAGTDSRVEVRS